MTYVLEAGLPTAVLEAETRAMAGAAKRAGVAVVGGDTTVVEHGKADQMYVTTCGLGRPIPGVTLAPLSVRPGDKIILSGPIGDHGVTILLQRARRTGPGGGAVSVRTRDRSPAARRGSGSAPPALVFDGMPAIPPAGGVATSLNELARDCEGSACSLK